MKVRTVIAATILISGCSGAGGSAHGNGDKDKTAQKVSLTVSPQQVALGSMLSLRLHNGTGNNIGYNLCTSALHTASGDPIATNQVCTMELKTLAPNTTARYEYVLPSNLLPRRYRASSVVHHMANGEQEEIWSNQFEVL